MLLLGKSLCCHLRYADAENMFRQACPTAPETYRKTTEPPFWAILWLARVLHYQAKNIDAQNFLSCYFL